MSPDELCLHAKTMGYTSVAMTDRDNLYGLWSFLSACRRHGLKPVVGCEISEPGGSRIATCFVKNELGYRNVCRLITRRQTISQFSLLQELPGKCEGIILLLREKELLCRLQQDGNDVYADLGPQPSAKARNLRAWAREKRIPAAATYDCDVAKKEDADLFTLLRAIDENTSLSTAYKKYPCDRITSFVSQERLAERFAIWPEVLEAEVEIAEKCVFSGPGCGVMMPPWKGEAYAGETLREKAYQGARKRYGEDLAEAVVDRLEHELTIIDTMGFSSYFLVVRDIVHRQEASGRRKKRRICGRGSGAASLVAYCLEITNVCPIKYNLYFERFLNPGRVDPPDIDVDFSWDERDEVLEQVLADHRGRAAMVCNHIFFKPRMAIRETAKAFGMPEYEISNITKKLPWMYREVDDMVSALQAAPTLRGCVFSEPWPEIIGLAGRLVGLPRYLSVHPGGVVITPDRIDNYVPVEKAPKGVPIIQWEKDGTEEAGLIKIDLLGNRSLGVIRDCIQSVQQRGVHFDEQRWEPEDDPLTRETVAAGNTMGCFYIESPAMRLLQKKAGTGDYEQLVIQSSIIRPAANEFVREYVRRLHGGSWQPLHEKMGDVLDETFGLMVYQEDVSRVAVHLAGFSHARADGLRKIMSKKDKKYRLADYMGQFYRGCRANDIGDKEIEKMWQMMMSFDGYSFCKPHSASYAKVSFQAAYLKTYFPAEFMAAVITNQGGYYSTFAYVSEAKRLGVKILHPDVNTSVMGWRGKGPYISVGLQSVYGVSGKLIDRICTTREAEGMFSSIADFFFRAKPQEDEARQLIHAGALDSLQKGGNRTQFLWELARYCRKEKTARSMPLFGAVLPEAPSLPPPSRKEMLRREYRALGFLCKEHPILLFAEKLGRRVISTQLQKNVGRRIRFVGWLLTGKLVSTRTGEAMEFLTFEDECGVVETTFFPKVYDRYAHVLSSGKPYVLYGLVEEDYGAVTLTVEQLEILEKMK